MTDLKEKITPLKNAEDYEQLTADYETDKQELKAEIEKWKNVAVKRDNLLREKDKLIDRLTEERDDWKREAHASRRIEIEKKQNQEKNTFLEKFQELQQQKTNH